MELTLSKDSFVNGKYYVSYGVRQQAMFTIVNEEFPGNNTLGKINIITCMTRKYDVAGNIISSMLNGLVIGIGDGVVGVKSSVTSLIGKQLNQDNMGSCIVVLYEDS